MCIIIFLPFSLCLPFHPLKSGRELGLTLSKPFSMGLYIL